MAVLAACRLLVVLLPFFSNAVAYRKLTTYYNYNCSIPECYDPNNSTYNLVYIKADGHLDTLHYVISFTGIPSVLVVQTAPTAVISISWEHTPPFVAVKPKSSIMYSYALIFLKLKEYKDTDDSADINSYPGNETQWNNYTLSDLEWDSVWKKNLSGKNMAVFQVSENGSLLFDFKAHSSNAREDQLPHLEYNDNMTQFDFIINHLVPHFKRSRFALEVAFMSSVGNSFELEEISFLDDEYSPGVFKIWNWIVSDKHGNAGYLQWKPVCYQMSSRNRKYATSVRTYSIVKITDEGVFKNSVAYHYFMADKMFVASRTHISFGLPLDGTYTKTNYTAWSASIGYGSPPEDKVSKIIIIIISVGLGLPVITIIVGAIFLLVKRYRNNYTAIYPVVN